MCSCAEGDGPGQAEGVAPARADVAAELRAPADPHAILLQIPSPIALTRGPEHIIELANPACAQIVGGRVGYTREDLEQGRINWRDLTP